MHLTSTDEKLEYKVIKKPYLNIEGPKLESFKKEVSGLVKKSWGAFDLKYIENSIFESYYLCLLYDNKKLIALAPLKKLNIFGSDVYSFGLTVIDPEYRGKNFLNKMTGILAKKIILESIVRFRFKLELIFITPNIRTLGTISRISDFIYPNPYEVDLEGRVIEADDETWKRVKEFLRISGENYRELEREGSIMEGFYDDKKHLIVKELNNRDKALNQFGKKYLYNKPGREVVVRAIVDIRSLQQRQKMKWSVSELENKYKVNPTIFLVLYFGTSPLFLFLLYKSIINVKNLDKILIYFLLDLVVFMLPFLYIMIFGKNLSKKFYYYLLVIIIIAFLISFRKVIFMFL